MTYGNCYDRAEGYRNRNVRELLWILQGETGEQIDAGHLLRRLYER